MGNLALGQQQLGFQREQFETGKQQFQQGFEMANRPPSFLDVLGGIFGSFAGGAGRAAGGPGGFLGGVFG